MIGVITAVASERDAVLAIMTDVRAHHVHKIEFYEGVIHNTPCITAMSGVGKVNASRCAQLLIDKFAPDRIVNLGSAGALHPDLNIGDVIISTSCIQHDVDLTAFGLPKGYFAAEDGFIAADLDFLELCQKAMAKTVGGDFKVLTGPIATGDQFSDIPEQKDNLFEEFGAYCIEMEGAAIAQVCAMCAIPFVIIRSISDQANEETLQSYSRFKVLAAERCAGFLTNLVAVLERRDQNKNVNQIRQDVEHVNRIESFELDHDQVTAPYVRKAKVMPVNPPDPECVVSKFDVRFAQPNQKFIPNDALHTLEHLFAVLMRQHTDSLIDVSPMGCRTGFYFIFGGDRDVTWVAGLVRRVLMEISAFNGTIPGAARQECGNYREHDLAAAKLWAERFLSIPETEITNIFRTK